MRNRFSPLHGVIERLGVTICFLLLSLATVNVFSQAPPKVDEPGPLTPSKPQLDADGAQDRAWFEERRKEHPDLKQVAEGKHLILVSEAPEEPSAMCEVWTLWKSQDGEFEATGNIRPSNCDREAESYVYWWIKLTPRMRPTAFKDFLGNNTSYGCRRTPSKMVCEETNSKGMVLRAVDDDSVNDSAELFTPNALFIAGLTRNSGSQSGETAYFTLYVEDEETETFPISFWPCDASIKLLRHGKYSILHNEMDAAGYQLDVREPSTRPANNPHDSGTPRGSEHQQPYSPFLELWVSENGILLSASDAKTQKEFIRLVQFKKLTDF